jgi:hypothetical protein
MSKFTQWRDNTLKPSIAKGLSPFTGGLSTDLLAIDAGAPAGALQFGGGGQTSNQVQAAPPPSVSGSVFVLPQALKNSGNQMMLVIAILGGLIVYKKFVK